MPKLTPEDVQRVSGWLREGKSQHWIATTLGVDPKTLRRWVARGRKEYFGSTYKLLADAVDAASGQPAEAEPSDMLDRAPEYTRGYNPEVHQQLVGLMRRGNYLHVAAMACGLDPGTVGKWIQQGVREPGGEYGAFAAEANAALASCQTGIVDNVHAIAQDGVNEQAKLKANQFLLAQRWPRDWGETRKRDEHQFVAAVIDVIRNAAEEHAVPAGFLQSVYRGLSELSGPTAESAITAQLPRASTLAD